MKWVRFLRSIHVLIFFLVLQFHAGVDETFIRALSLREGISVEKSRVARTYYIQYIIELHSSWIIRIIEIYRQRENMIDLKKKEYIYKVYNTRFYQKHIIKARNKAPYLKKKQRKTTRAARRKAESISLGVSRGVVKSCACGGPIDFPGPCQGCAREGPATRQRTSSSTRRASFFHPRLYTRIILHLLETFRSLGYKSDVFSVYVEFELFAMGYKDGCSFFEKNFFFFLLENVAAALKAYTTLEENYIALRSKVYNERVVCAECRTREV